MVRLTFVYNSYSFYIVCMYKKLKEDRFSKVVVQILYSLYIVCMYKKHTKTVSVSYLYRFCKVCTLFVCTKNINFKFQAVFSLKFVQVLYSLYIFCIYVGISCTFFGHSLSYKILICTIFVYKVNTNYVFCMIFVYILYNCCTKFLVRVHK